MRREEAEFGMPSPSDEARPRKFSWRKLGSSMLAKVRDKIQKPRNRSPESAHATETGHKAAEMDSASRSPESSEGARERSRKSPERARQKALRLAEEINARTATELAGVDRIPVALNASSSGILTSGRTASVEAAGRKLAFADQGREGMPRLPELPEGLVVGPVELKTYTHYKNEYNNDLARSQNGTLDTKLATNYQRAAHVFEKIVGPTAGRILLKEGRRHFGLKEPNTDDRLDSSMVQQSTEATPARAGASERKPPPSPAKFLEFSHTVAHLEASSFAEQVAADATRELDGRRIPVSLDPSLSGILRREGSTPVEGRPSIVRRPTASTSERSPSPSEPSSPSKPRSRDDRHTVINKSQGADLEKGPVR